jgi:DNA-binding response OmpR family regulator
MGKKIIVIDDDRIIQESLQEHLREAGYAVVVAGDGVSGFEQIVRERPDLVVADILLPRMHGVALCEKIKANDEFKHIPIILMTGVYKDVNLRMYVHKGLAEDFIEKPFREKDMLAKIVHLLGPGGEEDGSHPASRPAPVPERNQKNQSGRSVERDLNELIDWARNKDKK